MAGTIVTDRIESDATYDSKIELVSPVLVSNTFAVKSTGGTGVFNIVGANTNTDRTLTLPDNSGTVLTSASNLVGVTGVGKVLQVVRSTQASSVITSSTSYVDSGLSAAITPGSTNNKILVFAVMPHYIYTTNSRTVSGVFALVRTSTIIQEQQNFLLVGASNIEIQHNMSLAFCCLDSPSTTSSTTYKIQGKMVSPGFHIAMNTFPSEIILMEIAA
jgi:hypothetical protein